MSTPCPTDADVEAKARSIRADLANLRAARWMARHDIQRARAEAAERDRDEARRELADLRARVAGVLPSECWLTRTDQARCTDLVGGAIGNGSEFTDAMCCIPCRLRALLPTEDDQ